jgi:4-amino-4-deoxy-L-arabinose transferase-like glycosyltransferase
MEPHAQRILNPVTGTEQQSLRKLLHLVIGSFIGSYAAVVLAFLFVALTPSHSGPLAALLAPAIIALGFTLFYISLGKLAKRLGRSWIVWVGLCILTKPIGPIVACIRMKMLVDRATRAAA